MRIRLTALLLLLLPLVLKAREYPMLHYTQENGLPGDNVYRVFQDTDGMLWFATDKGVCRYNGLKFEHFTTADGLPDNDIFYFLKDQEGRLWMGAYNGALCYYKDGVFHTAKNTPFLRNTGKNGVPNQIVLQADSSIFFCFALSRRLLIIKGEKVYSLPNKYIVNAAYRKSKDTITIYGLNKTGPDLFIKMDIDNKGAILSRQVLPHTDLINWDMRYYLDKGNELYDRSGRYIRKLPDSFSIANQLNAVFRDKERLFLCTNYGLWMDRTLLLKDHKVSSMLQDREGNYWITTLDNGVYKMPRPFVNTFYQEGAYSAKVCESLQQGKDMVLGTTDINLYVLSDTGTRHFFNYRNQNNQAPKITKYGLFPRDGAYDLFLFYQNFRVFPGIGKKPEPLPLFNPPAFVIWDMLRRPGGKIYIPGGHGVVVLDSADLFRADMQEHYLMQGERVFELLPAPDDYIWYSSMSGIYKVVRDKPVLQSSFNGLRFRKMIFCREFLAGITPDNRLVITRNYNDARPVIDSSVKNNCVWDKFFPLTDSSVLVTTNDYYRVITFGSRTPGGYRMNIVEYPFIPQLAEWLHSDGATCYFFKKGTITGIGIQDLIKSPALPELRFSRMQAGNKIIRADSLIRLPYSESRNLSLYYTTLSFNTEDISFEYSISRDAEPGKWTRSNGINIDLFNIAAGDYTIRIRARTFGGRYSAVKTLQLHINAPFWLSWWFITLVIGLTGLVVFLVVRVFARRRLEKKEKENKFLRSEFTALNALMNPHFVFNSLNSVQSLINKEDLEAANQYVRTISDLLRQNMHNISRELIPLKREMELIDNYMKLEKLRFKERLQYTITMAEDVEEDFVLVPPLLVQPLVENAIKYTLAFSEISTGRISIDIYTREEKVYIDVTDNGRGLNASKAQKKPGHESTALGNIKSRLEQLSQIHGKEYRLEIEELRNDTGDIAGTRARIIIEL